MWQNRLKPKDLTPYPKCSVQIDYKTHPVLYLWLLEQAKKTGHSMSGVARACLYSQMEDDIRPQIKSDNKSGPDMSESDVIWAHSGD